MNYNSHYNSPKNFGALMQLVSSQLRDNWTFSDIRYYLECLGVDPSVVNKAEKVIETLDNKIFI